ncbi:hypothetical protein BJAS_P3931 [Bathymodiolus japonicus methanotrophic gill symbiont]|nr:hypothetical protein BJAS_P3931 [Bathymodiolus japonicus methanotrophic gill symbiont]
MFVYSVATETSPYPGADNKARTLTLPIEYFQFIARAVTKDKILPAKGSWPNCSETISDRPLIDLRISVTPVAQKHLINNKPVYHEIDLTSFSSGFNDASSVLAQISRLKPLE